jgi:RNA-directed DNA polymerase
MLEGSGHHFARDANDCNVHMRSWRAGERVLARLRRCYARLKLTINEGKRAVADVRGRAFLGYTFWYAARGTEVRRAVVAKAIQRFQGCIRTLTRRRGARSLEQVVGNLRAHMPLHPAANRIKVRRISCAPSPPR